MFHTADGLFFDRHEHVLEGKDACPMPCSKDGGVTITKTRDGKTPDDGNVSLVQFINCNSWASVISSMSALGETACTFAMMAAFQKGSA